LNKPTQLADNTPAGHRADMGREYLGVNQPELLRQHPRDLTVGHGSAFLDAVEQKQHRRLDVLGAE